MNGETQTLQDIGFIQSVPEDNNKWVAAADGGSEDSFIQAFAICYDVS